VAFVVDETFSSISGEEIPNIYQLVVEKANDETEPLDSRVSATIENIIERFFNDERNALIYICSDTDNKANLRNKVFNRWYQKSKYKDVIFKIEKALPIKSPGFPEQQIYTSFMFHKQNPNYKKLKEIYNKIDDVLNNDK